MTRPSRRGAVRIALRVLAAAACCGCSSIFTRGQVQDAHGSPVGGAVVRVYDETGTTVLSLDRTDSHGCFLISMRAPKGQRRYMLDVEASGFQPARQDFSLGDDLLIAALAPASEPDPSRIHVATYAERTDRWIPDCAPPMTMGSASLGPN
jgi:Carboxypeptidase regulatory-like domain